MQTELFSPLQIGSMQVKNCIAVPPMCVFKACKGLAKEGHLYHYATMAGSGVGMITIEATAVTPNGRISPYCLGIWDDETAAGIASIAKAIRAVNSDIKVMIQLGHAGYKASCKPMSNDCVPEDVTGDYAGWPTVAPTAMQNQQGPKMPRALETKEVKTYVEAFAQAAARAEAIGLDGVMIHAAHGYLIHEFLSPLFNKRDDIYGGSLENRMRFGCEVIQAVKKAVSPNFTVGVRVSATDWIDGGWDLDSTIAFARKAKELGMHFIDVSTGGLQPCSIPVAPGYQLPFAAAIKSAVPELKVFGVGLITNAFQAETALKLKACDVIDVGRGILSDPNWGYHAARDLGVALETPIERAAAMRH